MFFVVFNFKRIKLNAKNPVFKDIKFIALDLKKKTFNEILTELICWLPPLEDSSLNSLFLKECLPL